VALLLYMLALGERVAYAIGNFDAALCQALIYVVVGFAATPFAHRAARRRRAAAEAVLAANQCSEATAFRALNVHSVTE